jgi:ankyrin repeat protein
MKIISVVTGALVCLIGMQAGATELPTEAQKMLDDLGAPEIQQRNNGKTFRCVYGGTKTITVSPLEGATVFSGDFNNCREPGLTRDGYHEVIVKDGELVGESEKQSVNGELFDAAIAGDTDKVRRLIRKKADVNYSGQIKKTDGEAVSGWTPLMSSVMQGNLEMVQLLVKAGAWVNYMNSLAGTALWIASNNGNLDVVTYLIANRAYVNNSNSENITPLMAASMGGHAGVVRVLIDAKADINAVHKDGDNALMFAIAHGQSEVARILIDNGATVNLQNKFGVTPLMIAVAEGNEGLVKMLLEKGADATRKDDGGRTASDIAMIKANTTIIELLKQSRTSR